MDSYSVGDLNDEPQSQEIKLLGDLVLAVSHLTRHLTEDELDQVLELDEPTPQP